MTLDDSILQVAKTWIENQSNLKKTAQKIRNSQIKSQEFIEGNLIHKINSIKVNGTFCAIDGSIACEEFHGPDVALSRSMCSCFQYEDSELKSTNYFPNIRPHLQIDAHSSFGQFEKMRFITLIRLKSELQCAINSVEKFHPNFLLLDGSIAPLTDDKPPADSALLPLYNQLIEIYKTLYSLCQKNNCALIGITKDSRAQRLTEILKSTDSNLKESLNCYDTVFLDHLLEKGERTTALRYSSSPQKNPVFKDLGEFSQKIHAFYLKPVKNDRPLRVEFLSDSNSFSDIASIISNLSALNSNYAYPAILIDVDLRVALEPNEVEGALQTLFIKIGYKQPILKLRRNNRPFR